MTLRFVLPGIDTGADKTQFIPLLDKTNGNQQDVAASNY
jgi:hypothetical protein